MKILIDLSINTLKKLETRAKKNGRKRKAEAEYILTETVNPEELKK